MKAVISKIPPQLRQRGITLADQISFSAANFLLTISLARHYSEHELAAYGVGLSVALILQGIFRNSYVVQNAVLPAPIFKRRSGRVIGQQLILVMGIVLAELLIFGLWRGLHPQSFKETIAICTLVSTLLYTQLEFDRIVFLKYERVTVPFVESMVFLALNAFLIIGIPLLHIPFAIAMLLLGLYAIGRIFWMALAVAKPDFVLGWRLLKRDMRRYLAGSLMGTAGFSGYNHVPLFILSAVAPAIHAAAFTAIRGLMQPLQIIVRSLDLVDKNYFHARSNGTPQGARRLLLRQLMIYSALALSIVLTVALLGKWILMLVYGEKYAAFDGTFTGWALIFFLLAITFPLETVIVKEKKINAYNHARIFSGLIGAGVAWLLCREMGAIGAVIATLSGWFTSTLIAFWLLRAIFATPRPKNPEQDFSA